MTVTPQLMLNRKWYQASKPEMEFNIINKIYAALPRHAQTEKTTFSSKGDCILTKHTRRWIYSPLRLQYDLCRTSCIINMKIEDTYQGTLRTQELNPIRSKSSPGPSMDPMRTFQRTLLFSSLSQAVFTFHILHSLDPLNNLKHFMGLCGTIIGLWRDL